MKHRRKLTAIVMAAAMMLTMVPAAYAGEIDATATTVDQPTTIWAHGQEVELPVVDPVYDVTGSDINAISDSTIRSGQTIYINTLQDFIDVDPLEWRAGNTFYLTCDLDLSNLPVTEWGGYIQFFDGSLIGVEKADHTYPVISGFDNNTYLIYGMIRGNIMNITLEMDGKAGALSYVPTSYSDGTPSTYYEVNINNVDVTGHVNLTESDQSNYSPYVFAASAGDFTMKDCTNYADITGDIYGAVFHGYYAMNTSGTYTFDNCVNEGNIKLRNAAMFFGNPSTMNSKLQAGLEVNITNCHNNSAIGGTISAHYFAPSLNEQNYPAEETYLADAEDGMLTESANSPVTEGPQGDLCWGMTSKLQGSIAADNSISFTYDDEALSSVDHFIVTVSSYVNRWNPHYFDEDTQTFKPSWDGTTRYSVSETIPATGDESYDADLMYYGVADANYGFEGSKICDWRTVYSPDFENLYYMLEQNHLNEGLDVTCYATTALNSQGQPAGNGFTNPSFATVYAIDGSGNIIDFDTIE